jgi:hypothetical protein
MEEGIGGGEAPVSTMSSLCRQPLSSCSHADQNQYRAKPGTGKIE